MTRRMIRTVGLFYVLLCPVLSQAAIQGTMGSVAQVAPPPSVERGVYESSAFIRAFNERQDVMLPSDVTVNITSPGTYDDTGDLVVASILGGTVVQSHFIHFDQEQDLYTIALTGTLTFDQDILGIIVRDDPLDDTDSILGAPGTIYPVGYSLRGAELDNNDYLILDPDLRTLTVHLSVYTAIDQVRVITEAAEFENDCNTNGVPDDLDIAGGTSMDCDETGIPDECELISDDCPYQKGDVNNDGEINHPDVLQFMLVRLGLDHCGCSVAAADVNGDGEVDRRDIRPFIRLLRCNLGHPPRAFAEGNSVNALISLADELGVDLDLRPLLEDEMGQAEVRERPVRVDR